MERAIVPPIIASLIVLTLPAKRMLALIPVRPLDHRHWLSSGCRWIGIRRIWRPDPKVRVTNQSVFLVASLRSQRDQMFIDHDDPDQLPSSVGAKHLAKKHISLLLERSSPLQKRVYKHFAALRRRQDLCLELLSQDTTGKCSILFFGPCRLAQTRGSCVR